jgi:hypothetical protein
MRILKDSKKLDHIEEVDIPMVFQVEDNELAQTVEQKEGRE